ncbi:HalOD1 output domain-containing protein [Natronobacterium texcoconense]|uniref:Halobacterial output domain-containing protein n=1 Tax=Natronobacterium texcoconense TaxID=1095778 RepID=A0A1H1G9D9_NATTX|nr:HalOD1 output domain-containing protein [Natronobacterium texcoconense]SDR09699.1 hypothetical protein SAMN04489842_2321 [Natronobacterium texcoconense]
MVNHGHNGPPEDDAVVVRADQHDSESLLQTIVRAVAIKKNVADLPPLYEQVDPEAMTELLDHAKRRNVETTIEFAYDGCSVAVSQDGSVRIYSTT